MKGLMYISGSLKKNQSESESEKSWKFVSEKGYLFGDKQISCGKSLVTLRDI